MAVMISKIKVNGMHCNSCAALIKEALLDAGAKSVAVSGDLFTVEHSVPLKVLKDAIVKEGYQV